MLKVFHADDSDSVFQVIHQSVVLVNKNNAAFACFNGLVRQFNHLFRLSAAFMSYQKFHHGYRLQKNFCFLCFVHYTLKQLVFQALNRTCRQNLISSHLFYVASVWVSAKKRKIHRIADFWHKNSDFVKYAVGVCFCLRPGNDRSFDDAVSVYHLSTVPSAKVIV